MGFVAACRSGHLSDVDWHGWAHSQGQASGVCSRQGAQMWFETTGQGGGDWAAISVRCGCGSRRDFAGLVQVEGPAGMTCRGGQPWQYLAPECGEKITIYRRAASNLHFAKQISALDLQPEEGVEISAGVIEAAWEQSDFISMARSLLSADVKQEVVEAAAGAHAERMSREYGCGVPSAMDALRRVLRPAGSGEDQERESEDVQQAILKEEWSTLSKASDITTKYLDVRRKTIPATWPEELRRAISSVSMVRRMREVRALLGFRRLCPDQDAPLVPVDLGKRQAGWLPGVEAWGEGIFIHLNPAEVHAWELRVGKTSVHTSRLRRAVETMGWDPRMASLRFIMLHSLAHALIRRLGFDAGYSAASIRERIYSSDGADGMSGILLYTADGDSEGSLGGLVRMGEPSRLGDLIQAALADVVWCSADPVCKETGHLAASPMNAAACHACILASETTCCCNNSLLDRRLLVQIGPIEPFFKISQLTAFDE